MDRIVRSNRKTEETDIDIRIDLDGTGENDINTGIKFMDHMLVLLAKHSQTDITIKAEGDLKHHLIEDVGILLGGCFNSALGDKKGINRYGTAFIPMDDSAARCIVDFSGRYFLMLDLKIRKYFTQDKQGSTPNKVEDVAIEDIEHFFKSFAENAKMNLHLLVLYGRDQHHKIEAGFKAMARAIREAKQVTGSEIPSTKGML